MRNSSSFLELEFFLENVKKACDYISLLRWISIQDEDELYNRGQNHRHLSNASNHISSFEQKLRLQVARIKIKYDL